MCLVGLRFDPGAEEPLLLLANRDESFARPTAALARWDDADVLGGRDLEKGGTWLGVTPRGRFAAVTNVRHPRARRAGRSRGDLTRAFLVGDEAPRAYAERVARAAHEVASFNLLLGDGREVFYVADHAEADGGHPEVRSLEPGVHVVSNARLGDAWPKVRRLDALLRAEATLTASDAALLEALGDRTGAPDDALPSTGVPLDVERLLAPPFIALAEYGTRASTILRVSRAGVRIVERTFAAGGALAGERALSATR